jgi:hypothetical protein
MAYNPTSGSKNPCCQQSTVFDLSAYNMPNNYVIAPVEQQALWWQQQMYAPSQATQIVRTNPPSPMFTVDCVEPSPAATPNYAQARRVVEATANSVPRQVATFGVQAQGSTPTAGGCGCSR